MKPLTKEVFRKFIHLIQIPILAGYTLITITFSKRIGLLALTFSLLVLLELEYIRIEYKPKITQQISRFFERFILRRHERNNIAGTIFYVSGAIIVFSVFDYPIAVLALLLTAFGDLTSALTGIAWGKRKIFRKKSYIGTLCGFTANILTGYFVLPEFPQIFIPMAIVASFVEMITQKLDDNLTVPLFSGFAGQTLVFFLGIKLPEIFSL